MDAIARGLVILFGLWLVAVSILMLANPQTALRFLGKAASTNLVNYSEITLRLIAGMALIQSAGLSKLPGAFRIAGWFVAVTSVILLFVPRRWHARYAVWWSNTLTPTHVRIVSPLSLVVGLLLIYAVV